MKMKCFQIAAVALALAVSACGMDEAESTEVSAPAQETDVAQGTQQSTAENGEEELAPESETEQAWGEICSADSDCVGPTDFCVKQPGAAEGYCSIQCTSTTVCNEAGAPEGSWTCNAVNCDIPAMTWCGPAAEIAESGNFLKECL